MPDCPWITSPESLQQDDTLHSRVTEVFRDIYDQAFADELMANHALPVEIRAIRDIEEWRVFLLLTPWMLSRIYLRFEPGYIPVPEEWRAGNRAGQPYLVLGPPVSVTVLGQEQKSYLNYHPQLGHYLIQPLILRMEPFASTRAVYEAWNGVIRTRNENIRQRRLECQWQQEVSRREFFTRLARQ